ncbi:MULTISPECIES: hypothetical protein [Pseudomonas]|uniref:hypothetical protein n=1 Tax=Pseudomonas TaxID=286 RepID=UPI001BCBC05C|nr:MULTISPECIES: hypothetical protein [Pseudomonas]MBS7463059.1 hypothetical protein [Pseudomonas syringae]
MLTVLSMLDERLRPKGSRDLLASESLWSAVGRKLIVNLTKVTSRAEHFMVAMLASRHAHEGKSRSLSEVQVRYVRAEQLVAYLRLEASAEASLLRRQLDVANFSRDVMPLGMHKKAQIQQAAELRAVGGCIPRCCLIKGSDMRQGRCIDSGGVGR